MYSCGQGPYQVNKQIHLICKRIDIESIVEWLLTSLIMVLLDGIQHFCIKVKCCSASMPLQHNPFCLLIMNKQILLPVIHT